MITGIIPCAGKGSRWGDFLKPLLPVDDGEWLINRTVRAMHSGGAERIVIVANEANIGTLANHMHGKHDLPLLFMRQTHSRDIWGAILTALPLCKNSHAYFAMPDTYYPANVFDRFLLDDFEIGVFATKIPERYGVIIDHLIINKSKTLKGIQQAWGVLSWSQAVTLNWLDFEQRLGIETYTQAFNHAIETFGYGVVDMEYYHDMATWSDYKEFVSNA